MKKKNQSVFVCQQCGYQSPKWMGQCPECQEWNSFVEQATVSVKEEERVARVQSATVESLSQVNNMPAQFRDRITTGFQEFDRVLGTTKPEDKAHVSGIVPGSVILIAGEPGIGKSTLVTQTIINILIDHGKKEENADKKTPLLEDVDCKVLYVNGEENSSQIAERVERLYKNYSTLSTYSRQENGGVGRWRERLLFASTSNVDQICSTMVSQKPTLVIVDSIQTMKTDDLSGTAGSFGQLKESTQRITEISKSLGIPTILIGHVTKEGSVAGPKVLEHIVDGVFELSGERTGEVRILRAIKNRFGATDEVGLFVMDENGLKELSNPSELFLQKNVLKVPGSCVVCVMEGTRPLLIETQALVIESQLAMPRRVAQGINLPRLQVISAVLQKHAHIPLGGSDIFVNVAGGFQIREPAGDLGIAVAMVSSQKNIATPEGVVCIGEVGLLGEIREVPFLKRRIKEAQRLGFTKIISHQTHRHISKVIQDVFSKK